MLAYIPSQEHESLFDTYCNQNGIPVTKSKVKRLQSFVESSYSNLSHVTVLAVDVSAVADADEEILSALLTFNVMYPNTKIIVVALSRQPGDTLLTRLVDVGIYNIISGASQSPEEDIARCMTVHGISAQESADVYLPPQPDTEPERQAVAGPHLPFDPQPVMPENPPEGNFAPERNAKPGIRFPKIRIPKHTVPMPRHLPEPEPIPLTRYVKPTGRAVNIGVCGTHRKIGTTHMAVLMCAYLSGTGFQAAYLESNAHKSVEQLDRVHNVSSNHQLGLRQYRGVDLFTGYSIPLVMALKYDFYIYDYGSYQEVDAKEFLSNDVKIVVGGSKPWELPFYLPFFKAIDGYTDLHFIMNFTPEKERGNILRLMGQYAATTHLSGYDPDPFECSRCGEMFERILRGQIESEAYYE